MSVRKAIRRAGRFQAHGFMVVHPRWLLTEASVSNVTPARWLAWHARREGAQA